MTQEVNEMKTEKILLWSEEEYTFPVKMKFRPNLVTYLHDENEETRPGIVVVPGGGYTVTSCTEGEIVARTFYEKGYNCFVLTYTTDLLMRSPLKKLPLHEISRGLVLIRSRAEEFHTGKLAICGFSAGGHLCGSLAVHYDDPELIETGAYAGISNRPDAVILSYPVVTTGEYAHTDSFTALLGKDASQEELDYMSVEKHISEKTPPTFLWHFPTDETVPVENSFLYEAACRKHGVPCELHLFDHGIHGMSVATEEWASAPYTGLYSMETLLETLQDMMDNGQRLQPPFDGFGDIPPGSDAKALFLATTTEMRRNDKGDPAVAIWPVLVDAWLKRQYF